MQVEMLIRSHDCYTLACSVDGIAEVLRVARDVTTALYNGRHYKLMVRLSVYVYCLYDCYMYKYVNSMCYFIIVYSTCIR